MNEHGIATKNLCTEELKMHNANTRYTHICNWNTGNKKCVRNTDGETYKSFNFKIEKDLSG